MIRTTNVIIKSTLRKKSYSVASLSFLLLTLILLFSYCHSDISIMEYLSFSMRLGQVGFAYFIFFAYECFSDISKTEYTEPLLTIKGEVNRIIIVHISYLVFVLVVWTCSILLWQLGCYWHAHVKFFPYIIHMFLSIVLNCFLPCCIAILTGAVLGLSIKRASAYCLILVILILSSSIPAKILYSTEINDIPILNYFDWFTVLMPNSDFVADSVYGISLEIYRWCLALGWISLLSACLLIKMHRSYNSTTKLKQLILILILLGIIFGLRFSSRQDDSIVRKDYRSDSTLFHELTYRNEETIKADNAPSFHISKYDMDITINNNMEVSAVLTLLETDADVYEFTLWHDLSIVDIWSIDGKEIPYDRNGDYLTVYPPLGTEDICMEYTGNCGKYFTNHQGIALPGYIPYFPVPGHRNIWDYTNQEINVYRYPAKSFFQISVNSNLNVFCNLPKVSDNTFAGTAETVSLYAGLLTQTTTDGYTFCKSPVSYQRTILTGYEECWENLAELVGEKRLLDLNDKIIFIQPETIMSTKSSNENLVIYDDHVILGSWSLSAESICINYLFSLIPPSNETHLLAQLFKQHIAFGPNNGVFEKPSLEELMILTKYHLSSDISDEDEWNKYISAMDSYNNLWNYQISSLGDETVIKAVYQYLISNNRSLNQIEFLYMLGGD